jgi:hypothetical protein
MPGFTAEAPLYKTHNLSSPLIDFGAFSGIVKLTVRTVKQGG